MLAIQNSSKWFAILVLEHHEESVIVFEELVDFRDGRVIYFLELVNLLFKEFSLMTAYLVFIDDVDCPDESGLFVNGFP